MIGKKVLIDARSVGPVTHGFSRYISQLANGLSLVNQAIKLPYEPIFIISSNYRNHTSFFGFETLVANSPFLNPIEWIELPRLIKKINATIYHSPTFSSLPYCPCSWLVTVHDLNHLTYGGIREKLYYHFVLRPFIRKAKAVITVSNFSKKQISTWNHLSVDNIDIVSNSIDPIFKTQATPDLRKKILTYFELEEGKYFICLTNAKSHKNVFTLMNAYQSKKFSWKMVINLEEFKGMPGVCTIKGLSDDEIHVLLSGAGALVSPSSYEGFGLPPLEGASLGLPIIVSRIPAHEEVLTGLPSDEVYWVDPFDVQGWAVALEAACAGQIKAPSVQSRELLIKRYDVKTMGKKIDQIYRRVLSEL